MQVHRIELPGPPEVGKAVVYLVENQELTLVDCGPGTGKSYQAFLEELDELGVEIEEIDNIVLTHEHSDHFGGASKIREESGADTYAHEKAADTIRNYEDYLEEYSGKVSKFLQRHGFSTERSSDAFLDSIPDLEGRSVSIDEELSEGDVIDGLEVVHAPGHTPGSIVLRSGQKVFTGDTVLMEITPNPLLYFEDEQPFDSLKHYMETLRRLEEMELETGYPGHRDNIENTAERAAEIASHHEERLDEVESMVENRGETNAQEVMDQMFEGLPDEKIFFGFSEVYAHLRLLEQQDRIERKETDSKINYSA